MERSKKLTLIVSAFIILILIGFLGIKNRVYADYSENIYTEGYSDEFLTTLPKGSVVLTEGRDPEVFPALYNIYVNKKYPGISVFDQQGNIFPRLYGNMYNPPLDYQWVMDLRHFELFSMDVPVYLNWRYPSVGALSYLYLQKRKQELKVYEEKHPQSSFQMVSFGFPIDDRKQLEFAMDKIVDSKIFDGKLRDGSLIKDHRLKDMGHWYLKQEGLLFRVRNIRYAAVDVLEVFKESDLLHIQKNILMMTGLSISADLLEGYLRELETEGYIKQVGGIYRWIHSLAPSLKEYETQKDYEKQVVEAYPKNSIYWDRISKDMIVNKALMLSDYDGVQYQLNKDAMEYWKKDLQKQMNYKEAMNGYRQSVVTRMKQAYGYIDNRSVDLRMFMRLKDVDEHLLAVEMMKRLWTEKDNLYKMDFLLAEILEDWGEKMGDESYMKEALKYYENTLFKMELYASQRHRYIDGIEDYVAVKNAKELIVAKIKYPKKLILELEAKVEKSHSLLDIKKLGLASYELKDYENAYPLLVRVFREGGKQDRLDVWREMFQSIKKLKQAKDVLLTIEMLVDSDIRNDVKDIPTLFQNMLDIHIYWGDKEKQDGHVATSKEQYMDVKKLLTKYGEEKIFSDFVGKYEKIIENKLKE